MSPDLTVDDVARLRAVECDLVFGVLVLDWLRRTGGTTAAAELGRVVASIDPSDLSAGMGGAWCAIRALRARGEPITWDTLLDTASEWTDRDALARTLQTVQDRGMPLGWSARDAARRLLAYREARRRYDEARAEAASAVDAMRNALRGVTEVAA